MYKGLIILILLSLLGITQKWGKVLIDIPEQNPIDILQFSIEKKTEFPHQFSLLVWNTFKGKKESWNEDFLKLTKTHDLVCLQEVYLDPSYLETLKNSAKNYTVAKSFSYIFSTIVTGVSTGSEIKPTRHQFYHGSVREPALGTPKMTLLTTYDLKNSTLKLLVINLHGINFVSWGFFANYLYGVAEKILGHRGPIIFAGDFNTWGKKKLNILYETMRFYGMEKIPFEDSKVKNFLGTPLDHIFVRGLEYSKVRVVEVNSSDHAPLSVLLKLKNY